MLNAAIAQLEVELEALGSPREGTAVWYLQQAKSLGLSMLRTARTQQIVDPQLINMLRKRVRVAMQAKDEQ